LVRREEDVRGEPDLYAAVGRLRDDAQQQKAPERDVSPQAGDAGEDPHDALLFGALGRRPVEDYLAGLILSLYVG